MRVVLYYDLLRFSPRSIDLFISMNISSPSLQPPKQKHLRRQSAQGLLLSRDGGAWIGKHIVFLIESFRTAAKNAKSFADVTVWKEWTSVRVLKAGRAKSHKSSANVIVWEMERKCVGITLGSRGMKPEMDKLFSNVIVWENAGKCVGTTSGMREVEKNDQVIC